MLEKINKDPIPRISIYGFQGGRAFSNRYVLAYSIKFPCLPSRWNNRLSPAQYRKLDSILKEHGYKPNTVLNKRKCWLPDCIETSNNALKEIFGLNTIQCFNRLMKNKKRIAYKNKRTMWCIPREDVNKVVYRYRANSWNESEHILKEYQWLFADILPQFEDILNGAKPDYSMLDIGPDRKPMLYVCNICGRKGTKEEWKWDRPAGFASHHYIAHCPKCKAKGSDLFDSLFGEPSKFRPYTTMQDNYLFTF